MQKISTTNGYGHRVVVVRLAADRPVSDDLIAGWAMAQISESPSTLYGWSVSRTEDGEHAYVRLNTD